MVSSQASSLRGLRIVVNTQTPLVRFREDVPILTTGGVTRMLRPLLRSWLEAGRLTGAEWVAMATGEGAGDLVVDGIPLSFVQLPQQEQQGYALAKERLWSLLNDSPAPPGTPAPDASAWVAFEDYQRRSADALQEASRRLGGADVLYVHDFQQIGVARALGRDAAHGPSARVFHLHTPFPRALPDEWKQWFVEELRAYDAVIVSTRRYAENLRAAGLDTPVHVIRPFIDPHEHKPPSREDVARFRERYHIREGDRVILNVARMDPMKAQDRLLRAFPAILARVSDARLVLVGNGSFSSSKKGGLGLSKGQQWRAALEALARELGVAERVTFTGHLDDDLLPSAYASADVFCLPSTREGFGLAAVEAWRHRVPVVVSDRAGVAELVQDDAGGAVVDCSDAALLADAIVGLLTDPDAARAMGERGLEASGEATLDRGAARLERLFHELTSGEPGATPEETPLAR